MTEKVTLISGFTCPFGRFQWQQKLNNCLWGFVRLPPEEEALLDPDVLDYLKLDHQPPSDEMDAERSMSPLVEQMTVFRRNIPAPSQMGPDLGRSSYINDIAHGAATWDQLCGDLDTLLYRLRYWNISPAQCKFGKRVIPYLSHEIGAEGICATPKIVKDIQELPFPSTLKGVQSLLDSLNYYHKFIEDYAVVAASLNELTADQVRAGRDLSRAKESFEILKRKIVSTPLLRHPERTKPFVIIPHANQWAACAVLGQIHDGFVQPVRFTECALNDDELKYHIAEKEFLVVMRVLRVQKSDRRLSIDNLHSTFSYDLEIRKVCRDEDDLAAIMGAGITPREHLDEVAELLIPAKGRVKPSSVVSVEMLSEEYSGEWKVLDARGYILDGVTINGVEYFGFVIQQAQGLINCNQPNLQRRLAESETLKKRSQTVRLVHTNREFNQAADYLTSKTLVQGESWAVQDDLEKRHVEVVSMIREQLEKPSEGADTRVHSGDPIQDSGEEDDNSGTRHDPDPECAPPSSAARVMAVRTRSRAQEVDDDEVPPMRPLEFQAERWGRIKVHQEDDEYLAEIRAFLDDDLDRFSSTRLKKSSKVTDLFVLDDRGILYRLPHSVRGRPRDAVDNLRLVVLSSLREDILHYAHEAYHGGHQGITRTHEKLRTEFYWPGMYTVRQFVKECVDCASGKGAPPNAGPLPGNIEPRYPFEAVSMGFVTHMLESARGNIFLLLFQDMFSRYVMCKPMLSTTAQDVAEAYEEQVFQRFGASSMLRHDQDPRFMSEVFTSRQRAILGYRSQAKGQQERSVQTVIRSVRAYVAERDQSDWDEHAERLMFALNVTFDATRLDTPFHGWDARSTVSAMLGPKPSSVPERSAYKWRRKLQREYSNTLACAEDRQKKAKKIRSDEQTQKWLELSERVNAGLRKGLRLAVHLEGSAWMEPEASTHMARAIQNR
ncbi:LOW QUALITY PROTEIN: reverse transcriptase [Phytophthora megakarya]|uniref:Reverse transcriptase n=1 Tax=Phytophthora megakarya TaxID=4795 RepID=A0A225W572_9STRA|nr:LOW QUALITY PROTEIN: reverse transcriptase [Phytophthora megakarya]